MVGAKSAGKEKITENSLSQYGSSPLHVFIIYFPNLKQNMATELGLVALGLAWLLHILRTCSFFFAQFLIPHMSRVCLDPSFVVKKILRMLMWASC
jgi:hypothetical protein